MERCRHFRSSGPAPSVWEKIRCQKWKMRSSYGIWTYQLDRRAQRWHRSCWRRVLHGHSCWSSQRGRIRLCLAYVRPASDNLLVVFLYFTIHSLALSVYLGVKEEAVREVRDVVEEEEEGLHLREGDPGPVLYVLGEAWLEDLEVIFLLLEK